LNNGSTVFTQIYPRISNLFEADIQQNISSTASNSNSQGFYLASRVASSVVKGFKNNNELISSNTSSLSTPNTTLYLLARKGATIQDFSSYNLGFGTIGLGLNGLDVNILYSVIQQFQTNLGRQV
jgi:hypothetical protein